MEDSCHLGRGLGEPQNDKKIGVLKKNKIKQGEMEILREKLFCIGILNLALRKK